jgi:hypothetical protein
MIPSTAHLVGEQGVALPTATVSNKTRDRRSASGPVLIAYRVHSNGNIFKETGALWDTWLISGTGSDFEVRASSHTGDALKGGYSPLNTWISLASGEAIWALEATVDPSIKNATFVVEIRRVSDSFVFPSATIDLTAEIA